MLRLDSLSLPLDFTPETLNALILRKLKCPPEQLKSVVLLKKAVDARDKADVHFVLSVAVTLKDEAKVLARLKPGVAAPFTFPKAPTLPKARFEHPPVVVGAGPAGLFAALTLARAGVQPILIERGKPVEERTKSVQMMQEQGILDPESNVQFGEGGAGAFSDGKLTTGTKSPLIRTVLQTFVDHGAPEDILYIAKPHVGTDLLKGVVRSMRQEIIQLGGQVRFDTRLTGLMMRGESMEGITVLCGGETQEIRTDTVILAIGHSARDTMQTLFRQGVRMEQKPFAMGVRIEHPQALIDSIQYHCQTRGEYLPAAAYSLVSQEAGRGVYSFCMCPGGFIVPAMTDAAQSVVNGMSPSGRTSPYANSGMVTEVRPADFEHLRAEWGELAGLKFQQQFEELARQHGGEHQVAPAQRVADFVAGRPSAALPKTSYIPGIIPSRLDEWMPPFIGEGLRRGIATFGRRMRGFVTNEAVVVGVESRTSSPVRVPRDPVTLMHPQTAGLFPAGEGAGYAGGIISAALDGERIAEAVTNYIK